VRRRIDISQKETILGINLMSKFRKPIPLDQLTKPEYYAAYSGRHVWGMGQSGLDAYNEALYYIRLQFTGKPHGGSLIEGKRIKKNLEVVKIPKRVYEYIDSHGGTDQAKRVRKK
jgi:hypothetical protein